MNPPIAVTGVGLTTALGVGFETNWIHLVAGETGMRPITRFDVSEVEVREGGEVPNGGDGIEPRERVRTQLRTVIREALAEAGHGTGPRDRRWALVIGSSLAASASRESYWTSVEENGPEKADYLALGSYAVEPLLEEIGRAFDIRGEACLVSNACAAGASAVCVGADLLRLGRADAVLACGYDALDVHTFAGFHAIHALSPDPMAPFSVEREGMRLGDGFAALVLEPDEEVDRSIATLVGYGESSDAHHLTQPDPDGGGAALAMKRALAAADRGPESVDYVNLHATGTETNDPAEFKALQAVFGDRLSAERPDAIALHAVKPAVGHTLGGAGAVEAAITVGVVRHGLLPPTLGVQTLEPEMGRLDLLSRTRRDTVRCGMTNSFGFGGSNASLLFEPGKGASE